MKRGTYSSTWWRIPVLDRPTVSGESLTSLDINRGSHDRHLRPMGRQYVHMSVDVGAARAVGARKARRPVVLQVSAQQAARNGVAFYVGNDQTWLAELVPARYITLLER